MGARLIGIVFRRVTGALCGRDCATVNLEFERAGKRPGVEYAGVEIGAATTFFLTAVTPLK
jgi:hypothetical protein